LPRKDDGKLFGLTLKNVPGQEVTFTKEFVVRLGRGNVVSDETYVMHHT
jgi:hypothetical protein